MIFHPFGLSLEANPGRLGLLFLAIPVGLAVCTGIIVPLAWDDYERCRYRAVTVRPNGARVARPEVRLRTAMLGTWAIPAGLLWTCVTFYDETVENVSEPDRRLTRSAWTLDGRYSIFHPLGGQALFGAGFLICFVSSYGYLIGEEATLLRGSSGDVDANVTPAQIRTDTQPQAPSLQSPFCGILFP